MNELVRQSDLATNIGETTEVSWRATTSMTYDEWERIGRTLQQLGRSLNWWIGDWLNEGEQRWGEMYAQALEITGLSVETLSKYKRVAARVPAEVRRPDLSWSHHFGVAYAEERHRGPILEIAAHFEISSRDIKEIMRLSPAQLDALIEAYEEGELMSVTDLNKTVNQIRLTVQDRGTVNGKALPAKTPDEDEEEEPPFAQADLYDEAAAEEEGEVYIEEVLEFFDGDGAKLQVCTRDEAIWDGLFVVAAVDAKGKPYLRWGKPLR